MIAASGPALSHSRWTETSDLLDEVKIDPSLKTQVLAILLRRNSENRFVEKLRRLGGNETCLSESCVG